MYPPNVTLSYRAMASIFTNVFDKAEPQLHHRWISLQNDLGLPHLITAETLKKVSAFAESELGALILQGGTALNTGLPMTDNQRARQNQVRDADKKKAAAVRVAAAGGVKESGRPVYQDDSSPDPTAAAAGAEESWYANTTTIGKKVSVQKELAVCTSILDFRSQKNSALYVNPLITCQMNAQLQAEKRMPNVKRFGKNTRIAKNKQLKNLKVNPKAKKEKKKGKVKAKVKAKVKVRVSLKPPRRPLMTKRPVAMPLLRHPSFHVKPLA